MNAPFRTPHRAAVAPQADRNGDGMVDWYELVVTIEPLLGDHWQAKLAGAAEWDQWAELHWETVRAAALLPPHARSRKYGNHPELSCASLSASQHHRVSRTQDGYTRQGEPFWVNKLTGESVWREPAALQGRPEIEARRKVHCRCQ